MNDKVLHILHYVPNYAYPIGGREIFVRGLVKKLGDYSVQQSLISNLVRSTEVKPTRENVDVHYLEPGGGGGYRILKNLVATLKRTEFDLLHIHGYGEYTGDVACILKFFGKLRKPMILTTHGVSGLQNGISSVNPNLPFTFKERLIRSLHLPYDFTLGSFEMNTFDKVVVTSEEEEKILRRIGLKRSKVIRIPIAINDLFFCDKSHSVTRDYVLYVGRIVKFKGVEIIAEAVKLLHDDGIDMRCIFVGRDEGYKQTLENTIKNLGIHDLIEIKNHVSQFELVELYSRALATLLPSFSEGFPLCIAESMAKGTPFIASRVGAILELEKINAGLLLSDRTPTSLANAIKRIINPDIWSTLSKNGTEYSKNFAWQSVAKQYYELYLKLV